ncbi:NAD(P)H-dependent oxidoreductase [Candidatus Woesearchaeota archaeon CG_4_10_14_0_2_um_filter_33_13]|nr:MAG: NAD(P)H-dependent oxidoreductase [Candidatus Woesearchaeota archaeon CG_4_10_14_0_2_um_filter_33_13]
MTAKKNFLDAMKFRHACKLFDKTKKISKANQNYILELGRLSPSSMGLEQWKFVVIEDKDTNQLLQEACYNQPQVGTASFNVIILAKVEELKPGSKYLENILQRYGINKEKRRNRYEQFYHQIKDIKSWGVAQCHIAAANMMTGAAFIGIDSCPIGGFDSDKVKRLLKLKLKYQEVALIISFGHRAKDAPKKMRLSFDEVVEFY